MVAILLWFENSDDFLKSLSLIFDKKGATGPDFNFFVFTQKVVIIDVFFFSLKGGPC